MMPEWVVGYHEADSLNEVEEKLSEVAPPTCPLPTHASLLSPLSPPFSYPSWFTAADFLPSPTLPASLFLVLSLPRPFPLPLPLDLLSSLSLARPLRPCQT